MMPMFRVFSNGTCLGILLSHDKESRASPPFGRRRSRRVNPVGVEGRWIRPTKRIAVRGRTTSRPVHVDPDDQGLPAVMSKGLVGLRHAVRIIPLLDSAPAVIRCVQKFTGKLFHHRLLSARSRITNNPADAQ